MITMLVLLQGLQAKETENEKYLHHNQFMSLTENVIDNIEESPWFVHGWKMSFYLERFFRCSEKKSRV